MGHLVKKDVKYLGKDFSQFRQNLIDFSKNYFPNTYNDFNESSPGMMFIEMAAYVGDVLSFYLDTQLKESLIHQAEEKSNVFALAQSLGYKPSNAVAASAKLDVFQLLPAIGSGSSVRPDFRYALTIDAGMVVRSTSNSSVEFRTLDALDFSYSSSLSPTEVTVYQIDDFSNEPTFYLLKKQISVISGRIQSEQFTFNSPVIYDKITLSPPDIIEIVDVVDSDGTTWHHVPYLAQDTIFLTVPNIRKNDPELSKYRDTTPFLLKLKKTAHRFISRVRSDNRLEIQFGAGVSEDADEDLIPNPDLVGSALPLTRYLDASIDPSNFLYTKTYGLAPANTTLTVRYTTGGGVESNVPANDITDLVSISFNNTTSGLDQTLLNRIKASVACNNPLPAGGAKSRESIEEIQNNAMATFAAQNRAVTKEDYIIRTYSMPSKYGAIAKAYIVQDNQLSTVTPNEVIPNPLALNLYVLGYDGNEALTQLNEATKDNLKTYLSNYRLLTDGINIKDAFIINIGINFEIITLPDYNSNEVLLRCIDKLKSYFDIKKWQLNQPIVVSKIYTELDRVEGVQTVTNIEIVNLYDSGQGYSDNVYNIREATKDGVIYPSLDPSIFEVKFLNQDIKGKVVSL
jgi:hypothetical protein